MKTFNPFKKFQNERGRKRKQQSKSNRSQNPTSLFLIELSVADTPSKQKTPFSKRHLPRDLFFPRSERGGMPTKGHPPPPLKKDRFCTPSPTHRKEKHVVEAGLPDHNSPKMSPFLRRTEYVYFCVENAFLVQLHWDWGS